MKTIANILVALWAVLVTSILVIITILIALVSLKGAIFTGMFFGFIYFTVYAICKAEDEEKNQMLDRFERICEKIC